MPKTSSSTEYAGPTLYELVMRDAIERAVDDAAGRLRLTGNMHFLATRALFVGTEGLPNREVMRAIRGQAKEVARGETREVRHYRYRLDEANKSVPERTLKIDRFRLIVLHLLSKQMVSNADAVRSWAFALFQEAARVVVAETRKDHDALARQAALKTNSMLVQQLLNRCQEVLSERLKKHLKQSHEAFAEGRPFAEERQFLDFGALLVIEAMQQQVPPFSATRDLIYNVYREIDRYGFGPKDAVT